MNRSPSEIADAAAAEIIRALWPSEHGRALISKSQKALVEKVVSDAVGRALERQAAAS